MENKVIKEFKAQVVMPKSLAIGDEYYIDDYKNNSNIVYVKNFRGKSDWVGQLSLQEVDCGDNYSQIVLKIGYGEDIKSATLRSGGAYYESESAKEYPIGLDTATMYVGVDKDGYSFHTSSDGYMGGVYEFKKGNKLTGIYVDLVVDDGNNWGIESAKSSVESLFNCKLV